AARVKRHTDIPLVITEHSSIYGSGAIPAWLDRITADTLPYADARVAVSPTLGRLLESRYGNAACPWTWLPNIVDEGFRPADPGPSNERPGFRFLNVGNLIELKGQVILLRAFAQRFRDC